MRPQRVLLMLALLSAVAIYGYVFARKYVARTIELRVKQAYPELSLAPSGTPGASAAVPGLPKDGFRLPSASELTEEPSDSEVVSPALRSSRAPSSLVAPARPRPSRALQQAAAPPARPLLPTPPEPARQATGPVGATPRADSEPPVVSLPPEADVPAAPPAEAPKNEAEQPDASSADTAQG